MAKKDLDQRIVDAAFKKMHEVNTRPPSDQPNVIQRAIKAAQDATRKK